MPGVPCCATLLVKLLAGRVQARGAAPPVCRRQRMEVDAAVGPIFAYLG